MTYKFSIMSMETNDMARDIVSEAVEQAEAMKSAAYENAKSVLVEAMSTNLKAAVTEAIDEKLDDADVEATEDAEESVDEASVEEGKDWGGNKGDESKSRRDFEEGEIEEDEDEEEIADDAYDVDDDDEGDEGEVAEMDIEEVIEIIEDEEEDDDDEEIDVDVDVDTDDDDDEDEDLDENDDEDEEYGGNKGDESRSKRDFESAIKENKSLKKENARYAKALTFLKKRIDEVNLFNARLAAAGDLMKGVTLTKEEKERVVEHFDTCKTINEVKRTFKVLGEAYAGTDRAVKKQRVERPNVQSVISEESKAKSATDNTFARLSQLAGL
jgi:hypothetical protein